MTAPSPTTQVIKTAALQLGAKQTFLCSGLRAVEHIISIRLAIKQGLLTAPTPGGTRGVTGDTRGVTGDPSRGIWLHLDRRSSWSMVALLLVTTVLGFVAPVVGDCHLRRKWLQLRRREGLEGQEREEWEEPGRKGQDEGPAGGPAWPGGSAGASSSFREAKGQHAKQD